jgi:2',3'-cyclic-nucleotide 2'-phosphodiesterase (5'-nucleotidase family)
VRPTAFPALLVVAFLTVSAGTVAATETGPAVDSTATAADTAPAVVDGGVSVAATTNGSRNESTTVTLLAYNDLQTAAADNGSFSRMVSLVERRRAAHENPTVVVGGGDEVSPHSLSPVSEWQTPVDALNVLGPDAEVVGNHDLDYGFDAVEEYSRESEFPWLLANVVDAETGDPVPGTRPYTVVERDGVRVGVIGLVDEKIRSKTAVDFDAAGYELRDYAVTAREYARQLETERDVDVVVAAAHLGVPVARDLANRTDRVDAIVVGDDELEYPPQETGGAVIAEAEARAAHVTELNLTVVDDEVVDWDGRLLDVTENVSKNETVDELVTEDRTEGLTRVLAETETALDARFASNYHRETALGNLVTDAFRARTGAEVAVTNAGGIRSNAVYGPGEVTVGDVYSVLPFGNTLVTVELTGAELEQLLASQVVTLESEIGRQYGAEASLQVSGVSYEWVGHESVPPEHRIRDVWVDGEPLDTDRTYTVTVNSYMAGWDGSVLEDAPRVNRTATLYGEAVADYLDDRETVAPEREGRIRRVDSLVGTDSVTLDGEGEVTATFDAPANATDLAASTVHVRTATGRRVNATDATLADGRLTATFVDATLAEVVSGSTTLQVYGRYGDSGHDRVYFERSVLNGELDATVDRPTTTTTTTTTTVATTATSATTGTEPGTSSESSESGFGLDTVVAVLVLVGFGLLIARGD